MTRKTRTKIKETEREIQPQTRKIGQIEKKKTNHSKGMDIEKDIVGNFLSTPLPLPSPLPSPSPSYSRFHFEHHSPTGCWRPKG